MLELAADPEALAASYASARPYPHIVLDRLFADDLVARLLAEFPRPDAPGWSTFDNPQEKKLGFDLRRAGLGEAIQSFLCDLASPPMLDFIERLTGIDGLIPDPYLGGGGPHQILPGGFLEVHSDFNWHPKLRLDRRLNLLLYLNRDWRPEYGGDLELWDSQMRQREAKIAPLYNRTVVFTTTDFSYHGHPAPLACPEGMSRKSISVYYYSNGRPDSERSAPHDTLFQARPEEER